MGGQVKPFSDALAVADMLIERLHGQIVMGLPLGLGKANRIANAVYARAVDDQAISLTILTALTLTAPRGKTRLEQRFIDPVRDRVFAGYPDLAYAIALQQGELPPNIQVQEFFLPAGQSLRLASSQQNFISSNYTQAAETLIERGLNVVAQMVARNGETISLGSNADLTPDLLRARQAGTADFMLVGEVNQAMPFMQGEAELPASTFDGLLEGPQCVYPLFAPPKPAVTMADYAAGVWIASLIPDGGTLQIGIGSIGDAVAQSLILRHTNNPLFRDILAHLSASAAETGQLTQCAPFAEGLFGLSEMLVDSFLPLIDAGVIKREVDGALIHAAFFLGPGAFYQQLHDMTDDERQSIQMKPVSWVNSLYRNENEKRRARVGARFINNAMMATLLGAVVSDGLEDGRVVSGVGGQYDFVAQAFALEGARSVVALNATREGPGGVRSNILWSYGNQTVPRHLRDIIVTEYGVADLRNKTDAEVIAAMLAISDSRFQQELLAQARQVGKIDPSYQIPLRFRSNTPQKVAAMLAAPQHAGHLPDYPFGSDFTAIEKQLIPALTLLKHASASRRRIFSYLWRGMSVKNTEFLECLQRLDLENPKDMTDWFSRLLVLAALARAKE